MISGTPLMSTGDEIADLEQQIRDYVNSPRKLSALINNTSNWNVLCSAMDAIGDAEFGLRAFLSEPMPKDKGSAYIIVYGVLQLLFVKQDAVKELCAILDKQTPHSLEVTEIRELRNDSIGHPVRRDKGGSSHMIARYSLSPYGFTLLSLYPDGSDKTRTISLRRLIEKQRKSLAQTLRAVLDKLAEEERVHREKFAGQRLSDNFPSTLGYVVSKITEAAFDGSRHPLALASLETLKEHISNFRKGLEERGLYQSILSHEVEEIEYPIEEARKFFAKEDHRLNEKDAYIFGFFIGRKVESLCKIAEEIDEDYSKSPP